MFHKKIIISLWSSSSAACFLSDFPVERLHRRPPALDAGGAVRFVLGRLVE